MVDRQAELATLKSRPELGAHSLADSGNFIERARAKGHSNIA